MPPAIPDKLPCESIQIFEQELVIFREALSFQETEETWDRIARALTKFGAIVKGGGYKFEKELINGIKAAAKPITSAMNSERTRLSAAALECINIIAPRLGLPFEPLVPLFIPHVLRLATRPNKVYVTRSQATLGLILGYCSIPSIIPYLVIACRESKIATGRAVALEGVLRCLNKWDWTQQDIRTKVCDIEETIRITGRDKDAGIRQTSRKVFEAYKILFPERVEEFTGPLTPVMRKYLDIKPLSHGQKRTERVRHQSSAEKSKPSPAKPNFAATMRGASSSANDHGRTTLGAHARSMSSNAIDGVTGPREMPPPPTIPVRGHNTSRPQVKSQTKNHQEVNAQYERQRVVSAASSTYSTKSAPSGHHHGHEQRIAVRLTTSQNHPPREAPVMMGASGKARRVQNVVPVEPHPANRPDPAHKAPVRLTHPPNTNQPQLLKQNKGGAREPSGITQSGQSGATRIAFPTSEPTCAAPMERKGAQRVPKQAPPPQGSRPVTPLKVERPATVLGIASKKEVKPSIFRRGVSGKPGMDANETEKKSEGFAPRRGGFSQPTLSQLSKQKQPASTTGALALRSRAIASNRPVLGIGGVPKTSPSRIPSGTRGRGRDGLTRALSPELAGKSNVVRPAMVPLPASPNHERQVIPQLIPLPASPAAETQTSERTPEVQKADTTIEETSNTVVEAIQLMEVVESEEVIIDTKVVNVIHAPGRECQDTEVSNIIRDETEGAEIGSIVHDVFIQTPSTPQTPPFPSSVDGESEEDELANIEFATRETNSLGATIVAGSHKLAIVDPGNVPERSPLGDVVLNA